jgi:hypothetical protein
MVRPDRQPQTQVIPARGTKMKINCATENFRDMLTDEMDSAEKTHGIVLDANDYDGLADEFAGDVLNGLTAAGVQWSRCYSQSVGAMVAVQSATDDEREAFDAAVDAARPAIAKKIDEFVRLAKVTETEADRIEAEWQAGNV